MKPHFVIPPTWDKVIEVEAPSFKGNILYYEDGRYRRRRRPNRSSSAGVGWCASPSSAGTSGTSRGRRDRGRPSGR